MKKEQSINKFVKGILLDLNPLTITADTLTDCLNGTCLTYNGNEYVLQNEMGNARVETAMLPAGYIPIGSTSFGGIIYILSHNPIEGKYQIGSFPSPERNLTKDELDDSSNSIIPLMFNSKLDSDSTTSGIKNVITTNLHLLILCKEEINSGDKFKVYSKELFDYLLNNIISGYDVKNTQFNPDLYPKYIKIDLISVLSNGSIVKLTEGLTWTKFEFETETDTGTKTSNGNFYIYPNKITNEEGKISLEEYRNKINSQYDVYTNKIPGKLGVMLTYEAPNTFDISYDIIPPEKYGIKDFYGSTKESKGSHTLFENLNLEKGEKIKIVIDKHQYTHINQGYIYIRLSKDNHSNFDDSCEFPLFGSPNTELTELILNNFIPQQSSAISVTIVKDINSLYSSINTLPDDSIVSIGNIYYVIVSDEGGKKPIQIDKISSKKEILDKIENGTINSGDYIEIVDDIGDGRILTGIYQITYEKGDDPSVVKYELVLIVAGSKVPSYGNTSGNEGSEEDPPEEDGELDNTITQNDRWEQEIIVPETCSNARLIVGYTDLPLNTELHLVNVQIIKYSAKMYYYLNWSNENIGEHKNRVNFQGINIDEQFYPIINKTSADTYISPDARENLDYYAPKLPEDYNQPNFNVIDYLNKWNTKNSIEKGDLFLNTYRKNDGTDYQIVVKGNHLTYDLEKIESKEEKAIRELSITPYMPYGKLTYLTKNISIDVTKIGSDTIDMTIFRYYKDDEKINLNLWLDSYLDTNNRITGIEFKLYKFENSELFSKASESSGNKINYSTYINNNNFRPFNDLSKVYEYNLIQQSYNGNINHKIYFDDEFEENYSYQLEIIVKLSRDNQCIYFHRILHASNIFNDKYNSEVSDFKDLYLCDNNNFNSVIDYVVSGHSFTSTISNEEYDLIKVYNKTNTNKQSESHHTIENEYDINIDNISFKLKNTNYNIDKETSIDLAINPKLNNNNYDVKILDNRVTINYLIEYNNRYDVPVYELSKIELPILELIGDDPTHRKSFCNLGFDGSRQSGGALRLYLDGQRNLDVVHVDDGSYKNPVRVYYDLKSFKELHLKLKLYMDEKRLDILPIDIGLLKMANVDWGFRIRWVLGQSSLFNEGNIYQNGKNDGSYERFLYIRSYDNSTLGYFIGTITGNKTSKPNEYLNGDFRRIITPEKTYSEGYIYNDLNCFKKYQKVRDEQGYDVKKSLYKIDTISYPNAINPVIKCDLNITISNNNNIIKNLNNSIKNLSFDNINKLNFILSNYIQIFNQTKINQMLNIAETDIVIDKSGNEIKDFAKVEMTPTINDRFNAKLNDDGYLTIASKDRYNDSISDEKHYYFKMQIRYENYDKDDRDKWDENSGLILELLNFKFYIEKYQ